MGMCLTLRNDLHQQHHLLALYMVPAAVALSMYLPAGALAFGASAFDALAFDASAFDATTFDDAPADGNSDNVVPLAFVA